MFFTKNYALIFYIGMCNSFVELNDLRIVYAILSIIFLKHKVGVKLQNK